MKTKTLLLLIAVVAMLFLTSCHEVVDIQSCVAGQQVYGFWNGLWHGIIAGFSFIGSLFDHSISVYAVNNNGGWYNFGFLLGVGAWGGSGATYNGRNR